MTYAPAFGSGSTGTETNNRTIYINQESDFPDQDASNITLSANQHYEIGANVSTSKAFLCEQGSSIGSQNLDAYTLEYTGSGTMFSGVAVDFAIRQLKIDCPSGTAFDFEDTVGGVKKFICDTVQITSSSAVGAFKDMFLTQFNNSGAFDTDQGIEFLGTSGTVLSVNKMNLTSTSATFKALDFGSSQFQVNEIDDMVASGPAGSIGISGLVDSGNVPTGQKAIVMGCNFIGDITPLENIEHYDLRWEFNGNERIKNSINIADIYLSGGSETVTVSSSGVFYEIGIPVAVGVTWESSIAERFTVGSDGVITYIGESDIDVRMSGTATVEKVGGGSNEIEVRLAKNWTSGGTGYERSRAITRNSTPTSVPFSIADNITNGDNFRLILANNTGTSDIIANVASIVIRD